MKKKEIDEKATGNDKEDLMSEGFDSWMKVAVDRKKWSGIARK